jgi:hypothetical protein
MLYSFFAPVSHRYASGNFQHEWRSRFELELSGFPSPVRIRLGDNIRSPEAKQLDEGIGDTLVSDGSIDGNRSELRSSAKSILRAIPIRLVRQPERSSNSLKKSKGVMSPQNAIPRIEGVFFGAVIVASFLKNSF